MKSKQFLNIGLVFLLTAWFASCGISKKYLGEGNHLLYNTEQVVTMYDGSDVPADVEDALRQSRSYYVQDRNSKVFGIKWAMPGMGIYCLASPKDSSFWGNWLRRMGQEPVVYDESKARRTAQQLQGLLETKGCFHSKVTFDTTEIKDHKLSIAYHITATPRRYVDEVVYITRNDTVRQLLEETRGLSPLRADAPYDQDLIAAERTRIVNTLREAGFFRATNELVTFVVDTTYSDTRLTIEVNVDSRGLRVYHINNIYIYPNSTAGLRNGESKYDTIISNYAGRTRTFDYKFVYDKPMTLRTETISRAMMLFPGMTYRPSFVSRTYNSLLNLRNFKYINIEFNESPSSSDTLPLVDAHVRLINSTQQRLSLSLELTNASPMGNVDSGNFLSQGNLGVETSLEYQHKNLFGGAELLRVRGSLLLELPKLIFKGSRGTFHDNFSAFELSLDASLDMPVFLLPFSKGIQWQRVRPHTLVSMGGSYQYHYWYERLMANTSFGYTWSQSRRAQHQLLPVELTFVRIMGLDSAFAARIGAATDLRIKYQYNSHFIFNSRYDYTYSNQQPGSRRDFHLVHVSMESAGNLLSAMLWGKEADSSGVKECFGVPYSQYLRGSVDYIHYFYIRKRTTLVTRVLLGVGIPYGNSLSMPYEKSFYGGGTTTMRAWQLRRLGPGSYQADNMLERVGDIQLVLNLEGRFPIAGIFEGALFTDIGNVWLLNASNQYPGGNLRLPNALTELAVGAGIGLRVNVSIAVLRLDFGVPVYDPGFKNTERFRLSHFKFSNIVTNFGINYPF